MPTLHYFLLKLKAMKKLTILGVAFLTFSVFAFNDISHMLLVDILSDTPTETVESIPVIEPVIETPVDTNVVATDETISIPLAEEIIPATGDVPTETNTTPVVDADPATPVVVIPDCEPELAPVVAPAVAVEPIEKPAAEVIIPVEASLETPTTEVSTEIPTPVDAPVIVTPPEIPAEAVVPAETSTVEVVVPAETPSEIPDVVAPVEEVTAPTVPVCIPKQTTPVVVKPIEETPVKKIEPEVPFVDLYVPELTSKEEVVIDSTAVQSCNTESFAAEIQGGHSQVIPLLLQGSGNSDNSVKIGDVPKGSILTFVSNGLTEITGINFDNLMISADVALDAQKGSFNVPIIYSVTSKGEVSNAMCQLNLVIQ